MLTLVNIIFLIVTIGCHQSLIILKSHKLSAKITGVLRPMTHASTNVKLLSHMGKKTFYPSVFKVYLFCHLRNRSGYFDCNFFATRSFALAELS